MAEAYCFLMVLPHRKETKKKYIYIYHNLCCHKDDFGVDAEWPYFAVSHGRGACDGIGEQLKP